MIEMKGRTNEVVKVEQFLVFSWEPTDDAAKCVQKHWHNFIH